MATEGKPHPPWAAPAAGPKTPLNGLTVFNSLTDTKTAFVPHEGNLVRWYICGPTVYDSSHMGHARTYVAFDIIRRILSDYFGYDVQCVMNITDIDDKIILKARRNHLFDEFLAKNPSAQEVVAAMQTAIDYVEAKFANKQAKLSKDLDEAKAKKDSRKIDELQEALDTNIVKHEHVTAASAALKSAKEGLGSSNESSLISSLLSLGKDSLSEQLDSLYGSKVTDHSIFRNHAAKFEKEYFEDMALLGVRLPDVVTRVSEFVPDIIAYVETIIKGGFAYEANGSVYFDTQAFVKAGHSYGKLAPAAVGNMTLAEEGEGALAAGGNEKKHPNDFALWKASKEGEPSWPSPWGGGRPGWHIECSAMASGVLGAKLDVHCGGIDLCFPHHDNEIAQAEAYLTQWRKEGEGREDSTIVSTGGVKEQWVNYFLHTGHLYIRDRKMSKSLKNFFTIRDVLASSSPRHLRLLFLSNPWGERLNFSTDAIEAVGTREKLFREFFQAVSATAREQDKVIAILPQRWDDKDVAFNQSISTSIDKVDAALKDNFNTVIALQTLADLATDGNAYLLLPTCKSCLLLKAANFISKILKVFGIDETGELAFAPSATQPLAPTVAPALDTLTAFRDEVRAASKDNSGNMSSSVKKAIESVKNNLPALKEDAKIKGKAWNVEHITLALSEFVSEIESIISTSSDDKTVSRQILTACDKVRDSSLPLLGVKMEDRAANQPSIWKLDHPSVLQAEREAKEAAAKAAAAKKLINKLENLKKDFKKWDEASRDPATIFDPKEFSKFAENGVPSHDAAGVELSSSKKKQYEKQLSAQKKAFTQFSEKLAKEPNFFTELKSQIAQLSAEIEASGSGVPAEGGAAAAVGGQ